MNMGYVFLLFEDLLYLWQEGVYGDIICTAWSYGYDLRIWYDTIQQMAVF
jgi:hypothetical protein